MGVGISGIRPLTIVTVVAFVASLVGMALAVVSRHGEASRAADHAAADSVAKQAIPSTERTVRFSLHSLAPGEPGLSAKAGPGEADANSLLAELLQAIVANAYDDFVAKGSAFFKAAVRPALLPKLSTNLGARLAAGYEPTCLGRLHREEGTLWLFRLEFADGGDALVSMVTDGWQVAGFLVDDPQTNEKER